MRFAGLVAGCLAAGLVAVGCSKAPAAPKAVGHSNIPLSSGLDEDEERLLSYAEATLASRCMAKRGLKYVARMAPRDDRRRAKWGTEDVAYARKHGYGVELASSVDKFVREDPNANLGLSPDQQRTWEEAYFGTDSTRIRVTLPDGDQYEAPGTGCLAEARKELYGDLQQQTRLFYYMQALRLDAANMVKADPAYLAAVDRWRRCMQSRGYSYPNPLGAIEDATLSYRRFGPKGHARARTREIQIAVADATCGKQSKLVAVATEKERLYQSQVMQEHEGDVVAFHELYSVALGRAKRLLDQR
jgi:hypothetical protein